jgi:hypothetical protein
MQFKQIEKSQNESFRLPYKKWPNLRNGTNFLLSVDNHRKGLPLDKDIGDFLRRTNVFLSTKQVPSSLALRAVGTYSVYENLTTLLERGFPLEGLTRQTNEWKPITRANDDPETKSAFSGSTASTFLTNLLKENREYNKRHFNDAFDDSSSENDDIRSNETHDDFPIDGRSEVLLKKEFKTFRIQYEDPWLYFRAMSFAESFGLKQPKTNVWFGDHLTIKDILPKRLLGDTYKGKHGVEFHRIGDIETKMFVITRHTHWGHRLHEWMQIDDDKNIDKAFARNFLKRLRAFLEGRTDPYWRKGNDPRLDPEQRGKPSERASSLIEVLATVDGMFLERFLAYPSEYWTWEKFDRFTLGNIDVLLTDEFLDIDLKTEVFESITPFYTLLKKQRKVFKQASHQRKLGEMLKGEMIHPWLEQFRPVYQRLSGTESEARESYLSTLGILDQSRCCGSPPKIVTLQSKRDTLLELSMGIDAFEPHKLAILKACMDKVFSSIPDSALTGLATHATLRVTTAACWENIVSEGGTAQAINNIVWTAQAGRKCLIRDLDTGKIIDQKTISETTIGEYIFWRSLEEVLTIPPDELAQVWLVMVEDPGKARTVTKGRACLKVIYDVIHRLCARLLTKGISSSASGMEKSNHAWQFFKTFFQPENRDESFKELNIEVLGTREEIGQTTKRVRFLDLYCSSTDYKSATDKFRLEVSDIIGTRIMRKVGIPPFLIGIVRRVSFRPRKVFFVARGPLKDIGEPGPDEGVRFIRTTRGILMGDPLTKVILHMVNVNIRAFEEIFDKEDLFSFYLENTSDWISKVDRQ